jgi:hypothetical protein
MISRMGKPTAVQLAALDEDTAFERLTLDKTMPVPVEGSSGTQVLDFTKTTYSKSATITAGSAMLIITAGGSRTVQLNDLRPLLFGSAWKVLDLVVELAMDLTGEKPDRRGRYNIDIKAKRAAGLGPIPPWDAHPATWATAMHLFSGTVDLRHTLVHRRADVDPDGTLQPADPAISPLTAGDQEVFCRVAQRLTTAILDQRVDARLALALPAELDLLASHHGQPLLGGVPTQPYRMIVRWPVTAGDSGVSVDRAAIEAAALAAEPAPFYELELVLPDGRVLVGRLEGVPADEIVIDPATPLPYDLTWQAP